MQYNLWYSLIYKLFIIIRSKGRQFLRFFGWHYFGCEHRCAGDSDGDDGEDEDRRKARDFFESSEIFTSPSTKSSGKLRRWKFDAKEVHLNLQNVFALSTRAMERLQGFKACKTFLRGHMVRKDFQYGIRSFFFQHNLAIRVTYNVRNIYTVYSTSIQSIHSRSECFGFFQIFDTEVWICRNQKIRKTDYHDHQLPIHCEPPATNSSNMRKLWDSGNGS